MNTEKRCLFCKSKNLRIKPARFNPFLEERMFLSHPKPTSLVHCNSCMIDYSSYRPNDKEMENHYSGYRSESYQKHRQKFEPNYTAEYNKNFGWDEQDNAQRRLKLTSIISKYLDTSKIESVLDYGGDRGQIIPESFCNAEKYVFDVSNAPTVDGVINISEEEKLVLKKFDFIMCCHVLEHVNYPIELIKKLIDYCKDDGYIYIEVPKENIDNYNGKIHEHITVFSPRTFVEIMKLFKNINAITVSEDLLIVYILIKKEKISFFKRGFKNLYLSTKFGITERFTKLKNLYRKLIIYRILNKI